MSNTHTLHITQTLNLKIKQVENVLELLEEGSTVPFIARYRKEQTNSLNEVVITQIKELSEQLKELDKRKTSILKAIDEHMNNIHS